MVACNAFGSQRMNCISESPPTFWYWDYARRSIKNATVSAFDLPLRDPEWRFVTGHHQPGVWLSDTPLAPADDWQLCGSEFSTGMTGVRVQREGSQGAGQILAPERTNSNTFLELHIFLKQERGYIFLHFFLFLFFFFGGFGPIFEKVLLRYQYILNKLFSLFSICLFFSFLKNA